MDKEKKKKKRTDSNKHKGKCDDGYSGTRAEGRKETKEKQTVTPSAICMQISRVKEALIQENPKTICQSRARLPAETGIGFNCSHILVHYYVL